MDDSGVFFGRALGVYMTAVTCSPWYAGVSKAALCKIYLPINIVFMILFLNCSFVLTTTGPGKNAVLPINMWWTQLPIAATFLALNLQALSKSGPARKAPRGIELDTPSTTSSSREGSATSQNILVPGIPSS